MISVIIPIYNASKYLRRCLDSIINQTFKSLEIICINDGSKDASLEILKEYQKKDSRIKIINQENGGVSKARNRGLDEAIGDYITFVDADDELALNALDFMIDKATSTQADIIATSILKTKKKPSVTYKNNLDAKRFTDLDSIRDFLKENKLLHIVCNKIFTRKIIGKTRFNTNYAYSEDRLFLYDIYKKKPTILKYDFLTYYYYLNEESATNQEFRKSHLALKTCAEAIYADTLKNYPDLTYEAKFYLFENLIMFIRKLECAHNKNEFRGAYKEVKEELQNLSKNLTLNRKRKLELWLLKNLPSIYCLILNSKLK